jgi:hypothetical protein
MAESGAKIFSPETKSAQFKVLVGEKALDGSNPTPLNFNGQLKEIFGAVLTYKGSTAPGISPHQITYDIVGAVVNVYCWKATGTADTALVAGTDADTFTYIVFGV